LLVDELLYLPRNVAVQLALRLSFELRLRHLDADNRREAFANIIARQVRRILVLEQAALLSVIVDGARQRGTEAAQVRSAIHCIDVVREAEQRLRIPVVILERDLD